METSETLTIAETAALLHADTETVMQLARRGDLPGTKIGKSWIFLRSHVLSFLADRIHTDTESRRQNQYTTATATLINKPAKSRRRPLPALPQIPIVATEKPSP